MRPDSELREATAVLGFLRYAGADDHLAARIVLITETIEWCRGERSELIGRLLTSALAAQDLLIPKIEARVCG